MRYHYSQTYHPPAPTIEVSFISIAEMNHTPKLSALVDTGADATIVPMEYLEDIKAPFVREMAIRTQWGETHPVSLYMVDVQIDEIILPSIDVVGDEWTDEVILGRDILNRLQILLDGPKKVIEISV